MKDLSEGAAMSRPDFEISLVASNGVLMLRVRVSRSTSESDLNAFIAKVIAAFAYVEGVDEHEMQNLLTQNQETSDDANAVGFVFKRNYADPDYPTRLEKALRGEPHAEAEERVH